MKSMKKKIISLLTNISFIQDYLYSSFIKKYKYKIHDSNYTIKYILDKNVSVSRFGDGELDMIWGTGNGFQKYDPELSKRLKEILQTGTSKDIILCIPHTFVSCDEYVLTGQKFAKKYVIENWKRILKFVPLEGEYFNTNFTRFYLSHKDKSDCKWSLLSIKKFWNNKSVLIVEGNSTRFGVGNDLLKNTKSVKRILCPSVNAFNKYNEILNAIITNSINIDIVICALGMTATVLSFDLAQKGIRAIDIGHLDIEYEWMRMGAQQKCVIQHKAVNEVGVQVISDNLKDLQYENSIIKIIS